MSRSKSAAPKRSDGERAGAPLPQQTMPSTDHILCFLISAVLHLLGLLLIGTQAERLTKPEETAPELVVASVELSLASIDPVSPSDESADEGSAAAQPEAPLPPLAMPQTEAPPPPPVLPDKPAFTDAPPPPKPVSKPTPEPTPAPAPAPKPVPLPPAAVSPAPPAASGKPAATSAAGTSDKATIQSASGGGANGHIDAHPSLNRPIKPSYPMGSRRRGEEGTVILDVSVAADGTANSVSLVTGSGFSELDSAAVRAAERARFKPGSRNGRAVDSVARLTVIFRLRDP